MSGLGGRAPFPCVLHLSVACLFALLRWGSPRTRHQPHCWRIQESRQADCSAEPRLTQKAPNRGAVGKEFNLRSLMPRPPALSAVCRARGPAFRDPAFGEPQARLPPVPTAYSPTSRSCRPRRRKSNPREAQVGFRDSLVPAEVKPPGKGDVDSAASIGREMGRDLARGGGPPGRASHRGYTGLLAGHRRAMSLSTRRRGAPARIVERQQGGGFSFLPNPNTRACKRN